MRKSIAIVVEIDDDLAGEVLQPVGAARVAKAEKNIAAFVKAIGDNCLPEIEKIIREEVGRPIKSVYLDDKYSD